MDSARKRSAWLQSTAPQSYAPLRGSHTADVAIIGAGITGLTTALLLRERGKKVVVLEAFRVGEGSTGYSSAHLTTQLERSYVELTRTFGVGKLRRVVAARHAAISQIAQWVDQLRIDCRFQRLPGYWYANDYTQRGELERELRSVREVDSDAQWLDEVPLVRSRGAIRFQNQAEIQPVSYLRSLALSVHSDTESFVCEGSPVVEIHDGVPCVVKTPLGEVRAEHVVMATHTPLGRSVVHTEIAPYRSYVVAVRAPDGELPPGLFWDNDEPYHYIRGAVAQDGTPLLIVGGEDHKTGQTKDERRHYAALERFARDTFRVTTVEQSWSTELFESADGLPYIGHLSADRHTWIATGFAGDGLTFGTLAGQVVADEITGREHDVADVLSPRRRKLLSGSKLLAGGKRFVRENANVALHFVKDRVSSGDQASVQELLPGQGGLVTIGGKKVAAYRDDQGKLHTCSAVCTHMKCIVQWNPAESTWDCPCHGGRYAPTGEVISGPPIQPLAPFDPEKHR
jgi:glycine/D-amino acid oxidase-like deaminating enzyme/nitrite reductase/ring-hydroxylating ferredoxin subunit